MIAHCSRASRMRRTATMTSDGSTSTAGMNRSGWSTTARSAISLPMCTIARATPQWSISPIATSIGSALFGQVAGNVTEHVLRRHLHRLRLVVLQRTRRRTGSCRPRLRLGKPNIRSITPTSPGNAMCGSLAQSRSAMRDRAQTPAISPHPHHSKASVDMRTGRARWATLLTAHAARPAMAGITRMSPPTVSHGM